MHLLRSHIFHRRFTRILRPNSFFIHSMPDQGKLEEVLTFWDGLDIKTKFGKDIAIDNQIKEKFASLHEEVMKGAYDDMVADSPRNLLAATIGIILYILYSSEIRYLLHTVLDQFSRNMFRDTPRAFASDPKALAFAKDAIAKGFHLEVGQNANWFFLPFMHSEQLCDQETCLALHTEHAPWVMKFTDNHRFGNMTVKFRRVCIFPKSTKS